MTLRADPMATHSETTRPLLRRMADTFLAPAAMLDDFRRGAPWGDVLVVSTAVAILSVYFLPEQFFVEQMSDAVNRRGQPVDITSPPGEIARWGRYLGMLTALVSHPLFALALAAVVTLVFTVLAGATTQYRDHLSMTSHAFLIPALGSLLAIPLQYLTGNPDAQFNPGLILPPATSLPLIVIAGLDLFTIWMLTLISFWVGNLNPRIGFGRSAAVLLGLYLIVNIVTGALVSSQAPIG
jgi:hypothetical protein